MNPASLSEGITHISPAKRDLEKKERLHVRAPQLTAGPTRRKGGGTEHPRLRAQSVGWKPHRQHQGLPRAPPGLWGAQSAGQKPQRQHQRLSQGAAGPTECSFWTARENQRF